MRRLLLLSAVTGVFASCGCNSDSALKVVVTVAPAQQASCAVLEVSAGGAVLATQELSRGGRTELVVGLRQGEFPDQVQLKALAYVSANGCAAPRTFNGESAAVDATFPPAGVREVPVALDAPSSTLDADRDGWVSTARGGADCNDNDLAVHPGVAEVCAGAVDSDCDGASGCADSECTSLPACNRSPDRLAFATPARTVAAGACSPIVTLESQDSQGAVPVASNVGVTLSASPSTGVTLYSDAACTTPVTSVQLAAGQSQASLYFLSTAAGTQFTLNALATGFLPASQDQTVTFPAPAALAFTTPERTVVAGACSSALTLEVRDVSGTPTRPASNLAVTVTGTPAAGLTLYSDATCVTALTGGVLTIPSTGSSGTFYARHTRAGDTSLAAGAAGVTGTTQVLHVTAGTPSRIRYVTGVQGIPLNTCSAATRVEAQDANGNASAVGAATNVALTANPATGFTFYSNASCTTAVTQVPIAAGQTTATYYFRGSAGGTVAMTATTTTLGADSQNAGIGVGPPNRLVITSGAQQVTAGACSSAVAFETRDSSGSPSNVVTTPLTVNLAANPATNFQFFSDSACTSQVTSVQVPVGSAAGTFYFRGTTAGAVLVTLSSSLPTGDTQTETIRPDAASQLRFTNTPLAVAAGACSGALTVQARDGFGNPSNVAALTTVNLSPSPAGLSFYTASNCGGTAVTSVTIAAAQNQATFYARTNTAAAYQVTAQATGLGQDTQTLTVNPLAASKLVFLTPARSITAGGCTAVLTVQRQDNLNNPTTAGALAATLSSNATAGLTFHTDASCTSGATTALNFTAGSSTADFYVKATRAETPTLTVSSGALTPATQQLTVDPGAAAKLAFATPARSAQLLACSAVVTVQRRDALDNPVTTGGAITVDLTHGGTGFAFYGTSGCGAGAITQAQIPAGQSSVDVYFSGTVAEVVTMTASFTGLTPGTQQATVTGDTSTKLVFTTAARTITAGGCSAVLTVQRQDAASAPTTAGPLTVDLSSNATGSSLTFYSDAACTTSVTTVGIANGQSTASFYVGATVAETPTLTAQASGRTPATQVFTVNPAGAVKLVFTTSPHTIVAGGCTPAITVQRQDNLNNPTTTGALTVNLSSNATSGLSFHTGSNCSVGSAVTQVSIAAGSSSSTFYVKANRAEAVTLTASSTLPSPATQGLTVNPGATAQLVYTNSPYSITAGGCTGTLTVQRQDALGNPTSSGVLTLTLGSTATAGLTLHTDAACTQALGGTTLDIADLASTATYYVRATKVEAVTLSATATGPTPASQALTIGPDAATQLVVTTLAQAVTSGACSQVITVERRDQFGNPVPTGTTNVALSDDGTGFDFFTANDCSGSPVAQVTISSGATASFYVKGTLAGAVTITLDAGGGMSTTHPVTVNPADASKLVFTTPPRVVTAGECTLVLTVQRRDLNDNPTTTGTATVDLSSTASGGLLTFHADASCATAAVTTASIANGASTASFYATTTKVEPVTLTAASTGLTSADQALTVNPDVATKLVFTTPARTVVVNTCSQDEVTVQRQDQHGNPTTTGALVVDLAEDGATFEFFTASNCGGTATTQVTIADTASTASFYFRDPTIETVTMTASSGGLTPATQLATVTSAGASKLVFTTPARAINAGGCSSVVTVQRQDAGSNPVTTGGPLTVNLSSTATTGLTFHADAACSGGAVTSVDIGGGNSSADFYVKARKAEVVTLTGASGVLTPAQQSFTTNASKLVFTNAGQSLPALSCTGLLVVQLQDDLGNPVNAGADTTISFSATPALTGGFFSNSACTTAVSPANVTLTAGSSQVTIYFSAQDAGTGTLTASGGGWTNATQGITVTAALPTKLVFTTAAATLEAGFCKAVVIERQDALSRPTAPAVATTVTLTSGPVISAPLLEPQFFSDSGCVTLLGGLSIASGASSTTAYFKGRSGSLGGSTPGNQAYTLTASASGLTPNPTVVMTVNPVVRRGSCALPTNASTGASVTCAVTPTLSSIDRTFLVFTASGTERDNPADDLVSCKLRMNVSSAAEVVCERLGTTSAPTGGGTTLNIDWQTVSSAYPASQGGISVQHLSANHSAHPQDITVPTSSTRANTFVLFSLRSPGANNDGSKTFLAEMTSNTNVRVSFGANGTFAANGSAQTGFELQVVQWAGASVVHTTENPTGTATTWPVTQSSPNLARTFLLYTSRMADVAGTVNNLCARRFSGVIVDAASFSFQRGCAGSNPADNVSQLAWQQVELPASASVQRGTATIANNATTATVNLTTAVDRTRAFAFMGGMGGGGLANGRANTNGRDRIGSAQANVTFSTASQLTLTRATNNDTGDYGLFAVEVTP